MDELVDRWIRSCRGVGVRLEDDLRPAVAALGRDLLRRWSEPHRCYHDVAHLTAVLDHVALLQHEAVAADVVRLAAWFHDAVYDPRAGDNESRSADLARDSLHGLALPRYVTEEVCRLVLLTSAHDPPRDDADGSVLSDADLAVLAADSDSYERYVHAVRQEYAHVSDGDFARGRSAVLRSLLERRGIFRTSYGRTRWEAAARANLTRELARY